MQLIHPGYYKLFQLPATKIQVIFKQTNIYVLFFSINNYSKNTDL